MSSKLCCGLGAALVCLAMAPPLSAEEDTAWVGERVMVVRPNVKLRIGRKVVAAVPLSTVFEVAKVNGPWLAGEGSPGWVQKTDVVLAAKAVAYFTAAIERRATSEAYHRRGIARAALGDFSQAVADFDAAISRNANNVAATNDRGNAYRKLGEFDQALADFDSIIERNVRHPAVYTNRGLVWHDRGDYDRALADYNRALRIDARFAPAWEAGGTAREAQGNDRKAMENYRRTAKIDPKFARAHNNLAWLLATSSEDDLRDGPEAVKHATMACELTRFQNADFLDTLAASLAQAGRLAEAAARAREAIELADDDHKAEIAERLKQYEAGQ